MINILPFTNAISLSMWLRDTGALGNGNREGIQTGNDFVWSHPLRVISITLYGFHNTTLVNNERCWHRKSNDAALSVVLLQIHSELFVNFEELRCTFKVQVVRFHDRIIQITENLKSKLRLL